MRTLYLHVGNHRTGTTSIQAFMHRNRDALARRGVLYPNGVRRHLGLMHRTFELGEGSIVAETLERKADASGAHTVVLSEEDVCKRTDLAPLEALGERFDVRPVFFVRRQDVWLESWFSQNVKWQWDEDLAHLPWPDFLAGRDAFHWIHYDAAVRRLEGLFGAEKVAVAVFDRVLMPEGPVAAFARIVGIDDPGGYGKLPSLNHGFSPMMSEVMRRLPLDAADPKLRAHITRACEAADKAWQARNGRAPRHLMSPEERRDVMAGYAEGNAALASRRFGRDTLFGETLPDADAPHGAPALPSEPERLMDEVVAPMMAELIRRLTPKETDA